LFSGMQILQFLGGSFQALILWRTMFTAICRSTESSVLYANELLQDDCHRSECQKIVLVYRLCIRNRTLNWSVTL